MFLTILVVVAAVGDGEMKDVNLFRICENERWGYISEKGEVVIPPTYLEAADFSEGLARVSIRNDEKTFDENDVYLDHGFIDTTGKFVIQPGPPPNYPLSDFGTYEYHDFHDGMAGFWVGDVTGKGGYINKSGQIAVKVQFARISPFSEGLACVSLPRADGSAFGPKRTGFIDRKGKFVFQPTESFTVKEFVAGLCRIHVQQPDDRWVKKVIDRNGQELIDFNHYDTVCLNRCGLALVSIGSKYGYTNMQGRIHVPIKYDDASDFDNGLAVVCRGKEGMIINVDGQVVSRFAFDPRSMARVEFSNGMIVFRQLDLDKVGLMDRNGNVVLKPSFESISPFRGELAEFQKGQCWGYINRDGKVVWSTARNSN